LADVEALRPELTLLGVCALDPVAGLAVFDQEDAEIKRALLRNSGRLAAAVLNEKLETGAPFAIGGAKVLRAWSSKRTRQGLSHALSPTAESRFSARNLLKPLSRRRPRQLFAPFFHACRTNPNDRRAPRACP
jgi:hypothetical protein